MMKIPFVVFALPRSRTAWMSKFLAYPPYSCGHDLVLDCVNVFDFFEQLQKHSGSVESGLAEGWRLLRHKLPLARLTVVRRPVEEVLVSLSNCGLASDEITRQICERDDLLQAIAKAPGVLSLRYEELNSFEGCRALFEKCHEVPLDWSWWNDTQNINVQLDMGIRVRRLQENAENMTRLRSELALLQAQIPGGSSCLGLN